MYNEQIFLAFYAVTLCESLRTSCHVIVDELLKRILELEHSEYLKKHVDVEEWPNSHECYCDVEVFQHQVCVVN